MIVLNFALSATLKKTSQQIKNAFIWSSKCRKVIQLPTTCHGVLENQKVTQTTSNSPPLRLKSTTPHFLKLLATFVKFCNFQDQKLSNDCQVRPNYKTLYANSAIFKRRLKEHRHFQAVKLPKFSKTPTTYRWSFSWLLLLLISDICRLR